MWHPITRCVILCHCIISTVYMAEEGVACSFCLQRATVCICMHDMLTDPMASRIGVCCTEPLGDLTGKYKMESTSTARQLTITPSPVASSLVSAISLTPSLRSAPFLYSSEENGFVVDERHASNVLPLGSKNYCTARTCTFLGSSGISLMNLLAFGSQGAAAKVCG